jgi:AP-4 complex subunit epsilon-1
MSGGHLSKEFFELVKSIGESRSKQEEDKIIVNEIAVLKSNLNQPNITPKKMKEYMIRAVYVEMLGHDASFAYIHAVKLTHEKTLLAKRIGYLTCNLFLHKDHELMLLLINTMQRDLNSPNHLEVCAALTSVCRLVNSEMIPAISPLIFKLLSHSQDVVRKKAVISVHRFYKIVPDTVMDQKDMIRKVLCDPDPSVMGASLHILYEITKVDPQQCKDLVPSFVSILKQITEHRLPRDFDYHRMPAPWLQVKLLSILGQLGVADQKASEQMYEILQECMRRADSGVNVGYAIIYECVKCVTKIYPDHNLLEQAASNISRFISSDNHNLKYLGVTGLAQIVQVNASYAAEHQMVVVDCLEDPDETLKRKTLDLLYRMTNPQNVVVVVDKLTFHLRTSVDIHLRRELVQRITSLSERFAPNNEWYVSTLNNVFELGGDLVPAETAHNLMRLVAEGTGEDDAADQLFRTFAVNTYLKLLEKSSLTDVLVQVIAWVLGEYARLVTVDGYSLEDIVDLLCECVDRPFEDTSTRGYLVNALMKLYGQNTLQSTSVDDVIKSYRSSRMTDLQQRCYEFEQLRRKPDLMRKVLPYDASCEDIVINVEGDLPFLNSFVRSKLDQGAKPYQDFSQRLADKEDKGDVLPDTKPIGLKFDAYQAPTRQQHVPATSSPDVSISDDAPSAADTSSGLKVTGPKKWGPQGFNQPGGAPDKPKDPPPPADKPKEPVFSATASKPASKPAAPEPPEMTEKQKMAAALFGGIGSTSSKAAAPKPAFSGGMTVGGSTSQPPPPAAAPKKAAEPPPPAPPAPPAQPMNLLDFDDFGSSPAPAKAAQPPPPPPAATTSDDMLLLDMGLDGGSDLLGASTTVAQPAPPAPFLGPLSVTTQQVGATWNQLATERRMQIQTSMSTPQDMMGRMQNSVNVQAVEIIGMEGIAAGRVLPGNDPVFLHGKLAPPRLELMVRCQNPGIADRVIEVCKVALA